MFQAFLCFNSDDYCSWKPKVQFLNISEPIQNRVHDTEMSTVWKRCSFIRSELDQNLFSAPFGCITASQQRGGDTTAHTHVTSGSGAVVFCWERNLTPPDVTNRIKVFRLKQNSSWIVFFFYQNVWRLFLFINFCVSHQNRNVLHWTGPNRDRLWPSEITQNH